MQEGETREEDEMTLVATGEARRETKMERYNLSGSVAQIPGLE